jgi:5-methylcytosine-specific restriction protein B
MAKVFGAECVYEFASQWRDQCLINEKSLLWPDEAVWSLESLQKLKQCYVDSPDSAKATFEERFKEQLATEDGQATKLAAELLAVHLSFTSSVSFAHKRTLIDSVLGWKSLTVPSSESERLNTVLKAGVGGAGMGYNLNRPGELTFVILLVIALLKLEKDTRAETVADHTKLRDLMEDLEIDWSVQSKDVLLHLLFPDFYERVASQNHKRLITDAFGEMLGNDDASHENVDDRIFAIRSELQKCLPGQSLDFYKEPLYQCWFTTSRSSGLEPIDALTHKKQIIFYGPPGTSKTYEARILADRMIRRSLLQCWGPNKYFKYPSIDKLVESRWRRVQFHPGYAYEDFIRGLQLVGDGKTDYKDGVLLRIASDLSKESEDLKRIPFVVVLDEMNRADLSKVFGEAFSLMEDRGQPVQLAGQDEVPCTVSLPENLFFIGTMNMIDQSLEQIDFAFRRRFLWFFRGYDAEQMFAAAKHRWEHLMVNIPNPRPWNRFEDEFDLLARRAEQLNQLIREHVALGRQYEIGHVYFCDVVPFVKDLLKSKPNANSVLFTKKGAGIENTTQLLWQYSLEPLLYQYLSGADEVERSSFLKRACDAFLKGI